MECDFKSSSSLKTVAHDSAASTLWPSGLPDGLFSNQKFQFGYSLDGLGPENVGTSYDGLEYFKAIW
jgi:hypothetical protein